MSSDYFIGVGPSIVSLYIDKHYFLPSEGTRIFLVPVIFAEFHKVIKNIKSGNSVGYDGLSIKLLKNIAGVIFEPLINIFNLCISSGMFPSRWKIARVIPLHKKGDKSDVNNYLPIVILSSLSKVFEKHFKRKDF